MSPSPYSGLAEPTIRFCEANIGGWIAQPANSISSLAISLAGIIILARKDRHAFSAWLGWIAILTGLASFAYHATFTFIGQLGDLGSMYALGAFLLVASRRSTAKKSGALIIGGITLALLLQTAVFRTIGGFNIGIPLFALLLAVSVGWEYSVSRREGRGMASFRLAFLVFAAGWGIWLLDVSRVWCDPDSFHFLNGHSAWHLANALALLLLDKHYAAGKKP